MKFSTELIRQHLSKFGILQRVVSSCKFSKQHFSIIILFCFFVAEAFVYNRISLLLGFIFAYLNFEFFIKTLNKTLTFFVGKKLGNQEDKKQISDSKVLKFIFVVMSGFLMLIVGNLFFDIINIFSQNSNLDRNNPKFLIYAGVLAILIFIAQLYVALIRTLGLKQSQEQFEQIQAQKVEEDIEKRYLEGIKLLGDKNESVRIGGIYILWRIIQDAVSALPYLPSNQYQVSYAEYEITGKKHLFPYLHNEKDAKPELELKERYLQQQQEMGFTVYTPKVKSYLKAYDLHKQILNTLCAYVQSRTNDDEYLKQYYSVGLSEELLSEAQISESKDSRSIGPSRDIDCLLGLLVRQESMCINDNHRFTKPVQQLNFRMNLSNAKLMNTKLACAHFERAFVDNVDFSFTQCTGAYFDEAYCKESIFSPPLIKDRPGIIQMSVNLLSASFQGANCTETHFKGCDCRHINFRGAHLKSTHFYNSILAYADFSGASVSINVEHYPAMSNFSNVLTKYIDKILGDKGHKLISLNQEERVMYKNFFARDMLEKMGYTAINDESFQKWLSQFYENDLNRKQPDKWRLKITELETPLSLLNFQPPLREELYELKSVYKRWKMTANDDSHSSLWLSFSKQQQEQVKIYFEGFDDFEFCQ